MASTMAGFVGLFSRSCDSGTVVAQAGVGAAACGTEAVVITRPRVFRFVPALALTLALMSATSVSAQTQEPARDPADHQQIISANPFGLMFEWFNAEYERRIGPATTLGGSVSWFSLDSGDMDYVNGNMIFRYYPSGRALSGFFLGGRGGVFRVSDAVDSGVFFGAGFEIGYNWLLGARRNVGISLGVGATRLFGGRLSGASLTIPTVRLLNLGVAF
jgi:hypothetical protein